MLSRRVSWIGCLAAHGAIAIAVAAAVAAPPATEAGAAAEPGSVPVIQAADALEHEGQERCVEMVVRAARKLPDKEICFLNSDKDHRAEDNFTAVIFKAGLKRFQEDGVENPALHFIDATIRVRGVIETRDGRPQIVIAEPGQVTIVKVAEPAER
jgi:hypothetical protein